MAHGKIAAIPNCRASNEKKVLIRTMPKSAFNLNLINGLGIDRVKIHFQIVMELLYFAESKQLLIILQKNELKIQSRSTSAIEQTIIEHQKNGRDEATVYENLTVRQVI